jgi:hypothetical protein
MRHPNTNDAPQGTEVSWSDAYPEQVEAIIWARYSAASGEYQATQARFRIDHESKTITLEHVSVKAPYSPWNDTLTNPAYFVTDRMRRAVRAFIAKETGSAYWRVNV